MLTKGQRRFLQYASDNPGHPTADIVAKYGLELVSEMRKNGHIRVTSPLVSPSVVYIILPPFACL